MKHLIISITISLLLTGCSLKTEQGNSNQSQVSSETAADFPSYTITEMIEGKADLIALVHVESVRMVNNSEGAHQEAVLNIIEQLFGSAKSHQISLYQSVNQVQKGRKYLLFLSYSPEIDQYVVSDGLSQTEYKDGNLTVNVKGIEGTYSLNEFRDLLRNIQENTP